MRTITDKKLGSLVVREGENVEAPALATVGQAARAMEEAAALAQVAVYRREWEAKEGENENKK